VTLATFVRDSDTAEAQAHVAQYCEQVVMVPMPRSRWRDTLAFGASLAQGQPFLVTRDHVQAMHTAVRALAADHAFDHIHADQLWMAPYALSAQAAARGQRPLTILDQHNAVHLIPGRMAASARNPLRRLLLQREAALLARYEAGMCRAFDRVVTVSEQDREALLTLSPTQPPKISAVIPICVSANGHAATRMPSAGANVLFLGGMHWPPNADGVRWFVREVWPAIRAELPAAQFWAIGRQPPPELHGNELASRAGVHAAGFVSNLREHWEQANVFVVPLLAGGGMRVKILNAWQRGLPVISTRVGAEGLQVTEGENILLADTPAAFAQATLRLLNDPALAQRLGQAGPETIRRHYDWHTVYAAWDSVYAPP
jgi:glycosyltransferase involved in cell wall biosynthesis